ncbi:hypothetical protein Tco_0921771, partial [Tanacetum coccineum]
QAESAAMSCYTPLEVADGTGVWVKCIMKRRRTRLDVGRKDDKEEAATKVFDMMIRNTSPKVGEQKEETQNPQSPEPEEDQPEDRSRTEQIPEEFFSRTEFSRNRDKNRRRRRYKKRQQERRKTETRREEGGGEGKEGIRTEELLRGEKNKKKKEK